MTIEELATQFGVSHLVGAPLRDPADDEATPTAHYVEKRLEELAAGQKMDARVKGRPGGALIYFVVWDVFAFVLGWAVTTPFLVTEVSLGGLTSFDMLLVDWRFKCALYFCKIVIALLSFPFLIFSIPLMQIWLTHVKPTGYDRAGNCMPRMSSKQIKDKFRQQHSLHKEMTESKNGDGGCCGAGSSCFEGQGCWDRCLGIDPDYDLILVDDETGNVTTVVEAARRARQRQLRKERLPEATLMPIVHSTDERMRGKLQFSGDASAMSMMML